MLTTDDVCPRPLLEVAPDEAELEAAAALKHGLLDGAVGRSLCDALLLFFTASIV